MDKLLEMRRDHAEKVKSLRALLDKATTEKRSLTDDEKTTFSTLETEIRELEDAIKRAETVAGFESRVQTPPAPEAGRGQEPEAPAVITQRNKDLEPGIRLARYVKATLVSQKQGRAFEEVAARMYPKDNMLKESRSAMSTAAPSEGGVLVPEDFTAEIIPLLREQASIRALGARTVPMPSGNMKIPRQTGAANFMWVGENKRIISSKAKLGMMNLSAKKLAGMIPLSNELINSSVISADQFVRDELVNGIAESEDITAVYGQGTEDEPIGIIKLAGDVSELGKLPDSDFLGTVVGTVMSKKFPKKRNFGWIFNGALWSIYYNLKDGVGNYIHRAEMDKSLLLGYPFQINNNINVGTDAHGLTDIIFGDFSQFMVGETLGLQIAVSQEATYYDGTELVSAFANDQTVMRALLREDFGVRYKDAFVVRQKVYTK